MDPGLVAKLRAEIAKSGFPLELEVVDRLRDMRWVVYSNLRYADTDGTPHEIDALAALNETVAAQTEESDWVGIDLVTECKTSHEKPWVFFDEPFDPLSFNGLTPSLRYVTDLQLKPPYPLTVGCHNTALARHHYGLSLPTCRTYFEAFRKDAGEDIYKAIRNLHGGIEWWTRRLKAAVGKSLPDEDERRPPRTRALHPLLVFDGVLVLATKSDDRFELEEVPHILLRTSHPLQQGWSHLGMDSELVIDVVHKSHLEAYASLCVSDLAALSDHVRQIRAAGYA
jgi:hypothetical protein